jgi:hypothetical protein
MGFIFDKKKPLDFPPPPPPLGQKVEERCDRFGLPLLPLPFLCSDYEVENARLDAMLNTLIADAAETAIRHVGREEARRRFLKAMRTPSKGKRLDHKETGLLLAAHDAEIVEGVPVKRAALAAAKKMAVKPGEEESVATHIRRLARRREQLAEEQKRQATQAAEQRRRFPPSMFEWAALKSKTDF